MKKAAFVKYGTYLLSIVLEYILEIQEYIENEFLFFTVEELFIGFYTNGDVVPYHIRCDNSICDGQYC